MANDNFSTIIPISKSEGGKDIINARDLHRELAVGRDFSTWIKGRIEKYGFVENVDFCTFPKIGEPDNQLVINGMRVAIDYAITLDMAKELCMIENNEIGRNLRKYFIECEKKLREVTQQNTPKLPQSYKEALIQLLAQVEENERLMLEGQKKDQMIQVQQNKIEEDKPKVEFAEKILSSDDTISINNLAKLICNGTNQKIGEKGLFSWMRDQNVLCSGKNNWNMPQQRFINAGILVIKESPYTENGDIKISFQTRVTPKGQKYFLKLFDKLGQLE